MSNQSTRQIVFRADGDSQIGLGHIMRCLALSEMIGSINQSVFVIQQPSPLVLQMLQQASFTVIDLPKATDYQDDTSNFVKHLRGDEVVILDGYFFKEAYQKKVKQHCWKLLAIDDLAAWHQYADAVINHGGAAQVSDYQAEPYTKFFLGTHYALLRKAFLEAAKSRTVGQLTSFSPQRVLINLGGADYENISHRITGILLNHPAIEHITVVLGAANPHADSFSQYSQQGVQVCHSLTTEQMVAAIQQCSLAIVSCSTISYEVATIGRPFVSILTADNQTYLQRFYQDNQLALRTLEKDFIADELISVLSESPELVNASLIRQQYFFDGKSGERIAHFFQTMLSIY